MRTQFNQKIQRILIYVGDDEQTSTMQELSTRKAWLLAHEMVRIISLHSLRDMSKRCILPNLYSLKSAIRALDPCADGRMPARRQLACTHAQTHTQTQATARKRSYHCCFNFLKMSLFAPSLQSITIHIYTLASRNIFARSTIRDAHMCMLCRA
jgi:hypothetical protein